MTGFRAADRSLVGDLRQIAAVRRITLDDGVERGVRALAFSTGGGLDFWALSDRALDIGPLWWRGVQLAWIGPNGFASPSLHDAEGEGGQGFSRMLGGMVNTGGLDHIRQPHNGHPLHGRFAFTPASVRAYGEDWDRQDPMLYAEGEATQGVRGGPSLRLHRRIEAPIGGNSLTIIDTVENIGPSPVPRPFCITAILASQPSVKAQSSRFRACQFWGPFWGLTQMRPRWWQVTQSSAPLESVRCEPAWPRVARSISSFVLRHLHFHIFN